MSKRTEKDLEAEILESMGDNLRRQREFVEILKSFQAGKMSEEELLQRIGEL